MRDETGAERAASRRLLWFGVGCILFLLGLGWVCRFVVMPELRVPETLDDFREGRAGYDQLVTRLGGERAAGWRLALYLRLPDRWASRKIEAVRMLGNIGPPAAGSVGTLCGVLRSSGDGEIRRKAAWAVGRIGPAARSAVPALEEALADGDGNVRDAALSALVRVDRGRGLAALVAALDDREGFVRVTAARELGMLGAEAAGALPAIEKELAAETEVGSDTRYHLQRALECIARPEKPIPDSEAAVLWKLERQIGLVDFDRAPVGEAIRKIAGLAGVEVVGNPDREKWYGDVTLRMPPCSALYALVWATRMSHGAYSIEGGRLALK